MQLAEYLETPGVTAADIARKCGVHTSTITRTAANTMTPTLSLVKAIILHSGGVVTADDFLATVEPRKPAEAR